MSARWSDLENFVSNVPAKRMKRNKNGERGGKRNSHPITATDHQTRNSCKKKSTCLILPV